MQIGSAEPFSWIDVTSAVRQKVAELQAQLTWNQTLNLKVPLEIAAWIWQYIPKAM